MRPTQPQRVHEHLGDSASMAGRSRTVLTLGAAQGTVLTISADGSDAEDAIDAITELFESGFDETNEVSGAESAVDS